MKLSAASYSFYGLLKTGEIDVFGYLEAVRHRYGLSHADIWTGMLPSLEPDFVAKVKRGLEERELTLVNLCADRCHIWDDDPDKRKQLDDRARAIIRAGEILGAETIRIDAGGRRDEFTTEEFDYIVDRYKQWAQRAADHGYRVGPENHWGTEVKPANMRKLSQAVDHPAYGVLVHFKDPEDVQFMEWAMHTHISWDVVHDGLGTVLRALHRTGYDGAWSVEHHSGRDEYDEVAIQLAAVRKTVRKLDGESSASARTSPAEA